jgi:hypothetical protein
MFCLIKRYVENSLGTALVTPALAAMEKADGEAELGE